MWSSKDKFIFVGFRDNLFAQNQWNNLLTISFASSTLVRVFVIENNLHFQILWYNASSERYVYYVSNGLQKRFL